MRQRSKSSWYEGMSIEEGVLWRGPQQAVVAVGFDFSIVDTFRNKFSPWLAMILNKPWLLFIKQQLRLGVD